MTAREQLRIMTEEEREEERQQLAERADWEWEGRRPFVTEGDNALFMA